MQEDLKLFRTQKHGTSPVYQQEGKLLGCKWVCKVDYNGTVQCYKERLVVKAFTQKLGVDYGEIFAPDAIYH